MDALTHEGARIDLAMRTMSFEGLEIPLEKEDSGEYRQVSPAEGMVDKE